ncbi:MAG: sulfatase [Planctomycetota bacterium JB042]
MSERETNGGAPRRSLPWVEVAVLGGLGLVAFVTWFLFLRASRPPNVVLISIDTLRPDHLGCYGYPKRTSPRIDAFAAGGVRFERAHSTTSWTLPAHMALLSGQPDQVHGVVHDTLAVDPNIRMLAEVFREHGYRTGGYFGGPYLEPYFGFGQGFEVYENCGVEMFSTAGRAPGALQGAMLGAKERESHKVITAPKTTDGALEFLERHRDEPFFLFVHHWDVHYDFNAPAEFVKRFWPGPPPPDFTIEDFHFNEAVSPEMTPEQRAYLIANFDAEIAWVDFHVGKLLDRLDELGLADDTIVVVTADHGEEFFEHGEKGHRKNLYDTTLRIPLLVAGPGVRKGVVVEEQARIFDVVPTLRELCGFDDDPALYGESLVPLLDGDAPPELRDLPIVAELTDVPKVLGDGGRPVTADYKNVHRACSGNGLKYLLAERRAFDAAAKPPDLSLDGGDLLLREEKVYDLGADPGERNDLSASRADALERLRDRLGRLGEALGRLKGSLKLINEAQEKPRELQEQLDQLGY